jgi:hypothetical protein
MSQKYELMADCVIGNYNLYKDKPEHRQMMISAFRNVIFDCPIIFTGFVSKKGQHLKVSELVKEHFYPRQASAHKMFEMLDAGVTKEELTAFIIKVCQVHYVTKEENEALKKFQKIGSGYDTWEEQYEAAGIELVPYVRKTAKKYMYIIEGVRYNNILDVMKKYNCSQGAVNNRCLKDKRGLYPDWKRELYNDFTACS